MTEQQIEAYYEAIRNHELPPIVGEATIKCVLRKAELIENSQMFQGMMRVLWRDEQNRRVTSFMNPEDVKIYQ